MISAFIDLESSNDGTTKTVSVFAIPDAAGGMETIRFDIVGELHSVQVNFLGGQGQMVTMAHTAAGQGLVIVTALNSPQSSKRLLNVDKQPGDTGTAVP